jgi:hypothetical protein
LEDLIIFDRKKIGINPIKTIAIAGDAAWNILSSAAYIYVETASVSKLNGLRIKVAGSSLTTSDMTNKVAVKKLVLSKGRCTLANIPQPVEPSNFEESSIDEVILSYPDSIEEFARA